MKPYPRKVNGSAARKVVWGIAMLAMIVLAYVSVCAYKLRTANVEPPSKSSAMPDLIGKSIHDFLPGTRLRAGTGVVTTPFPTGKIYLLEFYFHRCPPCRAKHPALQEIDAMTDNREAEIIYIDNGDIDDVVDFNKRLSGTEKQYYDSAALLIDQLQIKSFPFEIILDKEGVIRYVSKGFDKDKKEAYIRRTIAKIGALQ